MSIAQKNPIVFISYSHLDKEWMQKLEVMLQPLIRNNEISLWADTKIKAI